MATSLHRLLIVVMSSDRHWDVSNIIMFMTILQDEVNSGTIAPKTQDLVRCCILSVLIQLARGLMISGTTQKDTEMVKKAKAVEKTLLRVAGTRVSQQNHNLKLAVCPVTGLLSAKQLSKQKSTDSTDFSEPDNLCKLFETLTPIPTEEQLKEWF